MTSTALSIHNLHFDYPDGTPALRGVTCSVAPGEAVALVGGNGAGKSTLLLQLIGYLAPSRGSLTVMDLVMQPETIPLIRRQAGLVFQNPDDQLFMPTVGEDVAFGPRQAGWTGPDVDRAVMLALEQVGAAHLKDRPPYRLSAGEKRVAALATVLVMQPGILLLDEPSSHLDPRARRRLISLLQQLTPARVIATHDLELALEVCTRVVVLDSGQVVADGPIREVLNDEALMLAHGLERPHSLQHGHPHGSARL